MALLSDYFPCLVTPPALHKVHARRVYVSLMFFTFIFFVISVSGGVLA